MFPFYFPSITKHYSTIVFFLSQALLFFITSFLLPQGEQSHALTLENTKQSQHPGM